MQIVWDQEVIEKIKDSQIVLELETLMIEGKPLTAYCIVPIEKLSMEKFALLEAHKELHAQFVDAVREKNYETCQNLLPFLKGEFGGELDSFYDEIVGRIQKTVI